MQQEHRLFLQSRSHGGLPESQCVNPSNVVFDISWDQKCLFPLVHSHQRW
jgi:hypothetical protein